MAGRTVANDLAEVAARFAAALRGAGLPVGPGRSERFASAVTLVRPQAPGDLYLCALATLVSGPDQIDILRAVFGEVFGELTNDAGADENAPNSGEEMAHPVFGSTVERLAGKDFAELSDAELAQLAGLMRRITLAVPERRSRRQRRRPGGPRIDVRATLRRARRTGGDPS